MNNDNPKKYLESLDEEKINKLYNNFAKKYERVIKNKDRYLEENLTEEEKKEKNINERYIILIEFLFNQYYNKNTNKWNEPKPNSLQINYKLRYNLKYSNTIDELYTNFEEIIKQHNIINPK